MGASFCNIMSLHVFAMCLLLVFQTGIRVVYVEAQSTNALDALGIIVITSTFPQLPEPVYDACYPVALSWVECTYDSFEYRVTALNLGGRSLVGLLPDFSYMNALQIIDLHDNSLSGNIPAFLGAIPSLQRLNLADNLFTGPIPSSLANNNNLIKDFSGNPGLGSSSTSPPGSNTSPPSGSGSYYPPSSTYDPSINYSPSGKKKKSKLPIILGIVIPSLLISAVTGVIAIHKQKLRTAAAVSAAAAPAQGSGTPGA